MARIRTIKPEFPQSESMGRVSRDARLCFILLWTISDDVGRLRGNSRMLASLLYPYDDDARTLMDTWLEELEGENCIRRYLVSGDTYVEICNWLIHQKVDKPSKSKFPEFDESSRIVANPRERSSGDQGSEDQGPRTKEGIKDQGPNIVPLSGTALVASRVLEPAAGETIGNVFEHWRVTHSHPRAQLDEKRRRLIAQALKRYSEADLCQAISGYLNSPHHMGENDRNTRFDDIELFLRDAKHIDAGLRFFAEPPRTDLSDQTRRIVRQTEDWEPPEVRRAAE